MAAWLNSTFYSFDHAVLAFLHEIAEHAGGVLTPVMKLATLLQEKALLMILAALVLMLFARTRRTGVCMFGAIACATIITSIVLKDLVGRLRPFEASEVYRSWWLAVGAPPEEGFSFPSGHVTGAVAALTALCLFEGRRWVAPSLLWVFLVGVSRNYLMAHYPSDVLFGALAGLVSAGIAYAITRLIFRILEDHEDVPFFAFLLDYDLPLRRGGVPSAPAPAAENHASHGHEGKTVSPQQGYVGKHLKK